MFGFIGERKSLTASRYRLTSTPSKQYTNPGLAGAHKLYDFVVPNTPSVRDAIHTKPAEVSTNEPATSQDNHQTDQDGKGHLNEASEERKRHIERVKAALQQPIQVDELELKDNSQEGKGKKRKSKPKSAGPKAKRDSCAFR